MTPSKLSWICDVVRGVLPMSKLHKTQDDVPDAVEPRIGYYEITFRVPQEDSPSLDNLRVIGAASGTVDLRILPHDTTSVLLVLSY